MIKTIKPTNKGKSTTSRLCNPPNKVIVLSTKISILLAVTAVNAQPFHIPPQSLSGALNDYAEVADLQLSYPASRTSGIQSDGLDGDYSP